MSWTPRKRFWQAAAVRPEATGFAVRLDDRPLMTPAKAPVIVPTAALAAAIAAEWNAVEAEIDPERLPLTRAANAAIDRVAPQVQAVVDQIAAYGDSDLLCYRAAEPDGLAARQAAGWDPWLAWAESELGAPLTTAIGIVHRPQPAASLAALADAVAAHDAFALTALHELVTLSGSLVLALAVARGALEPEAAWELSRLDETWQQEQWGYDREAAEAAARKRADFLRAATMLRSLGLASRDR